MFRSDARPVRTTRSGRAHHGLAWLAHHGADVFKVDVDVTGHVDDFGNPTHGIFQHVVGMRKSLILGNVVSKYLQQFFVEHHNQRIDIGFQLGQAQVGVGHATATFELERLGNHAHGKNAHFLGDTCDHRRRAGARTAAHSSGDKQHVRAGNGAANVVHCQFSGLTTLVGLAASTQTAGTELYGLVRVAAAQRLRVGVGANEFNALHTAVDHVVYGIAAAAANTNHLDLRALVELFDFNHFDAHWEPPG